MFNVHVKQILTSALRTQPGAVRKLRARIHRAVLRARVMTATWEMVSSATVRITGHGMQHAFVQI